MPTGHGPSEGFGISNGSQGGMAVQCIRDRQRIKAR
jgi:hypothetical protein